MPAEMLTGAQFDDRLAAVDRRCGPFLYATHCEGCQACEPIRLDVPAFQMSRTQARVWKRGQKLFELEIREPVVDAEHVALYNKHRNERELAKDRPPIDEVGYSEFLAVTCCETWELSYRLDGELKMVAIIDVGAIALSAVYTYFDPCEAKLSPGVYSVLQEIALCQAWSKRYLYLGFYVAECAHMNYKATYRPHERRVGGLWRSFD
jgi:arginine-tRNA-protein transferase